VRVSASYSGKAIQVKCTLAFLDNKANFNTSLVSKRTFFIFLTMHTQRYIHKTFQTYWNNMRTKAVALRMSCMQCGVVMEKVLLLASDV
jgi:hypothetical protein